MASLHTFKRLPVLTVALVAQLAWGQTTLLNASYDVSREFYKDVNAAFIAQYKKSTGKDIKVDQAHGGSSAKGVSVCFCMVVFLKVVGLLGIASRLWGRAEPM